MQVSGLVISGADIGELHATQPTTTASITAGHPLVDDLADGQWINLRPDPGRLDADAGGCGTPAGSFAFTTPLRRPPAPGRPRRA